MIWEMTRTKVDLGLICNPYLFWIFPTVHVVYNVFLICFLGERNRLILWNSDNVTFKLSTVFHNQICENILVWADFKSVM